MTKTLLEIGDKNVLFQCRYVESEGGFGTSTSSYSILYVLQHWSDMHDHRILPAGLHGAGKKATNQLIWGAEL